MPGCCKPPAMLSAGISCLYCHYFWQVTRLCCHGSAGLLIDLSILQFIDDVLDFTSSSGELGKPNLNDIKSGVVTAPVLYAAEKHPELIDMIQRKFKADGDVSRANELVFDSNGIERTRQMAEKYCTLAAQTVCTFAHMTSVGV